MAEYTTDDTEEEKKGDVSRIIELMGMDNIADDLDENELRDIGEKVIEDYEEDEESRREWLETNQEALKLARQCREAKTFPWSGASNVKYPLIGQAAMNFNARAYPEIVQGDKIVKAKVIGNDNEDESKAARAERISTFMSYQLNEQIPNWESDTDKLLIMLPIVGTMFKEVTWDEINLRPEINLLMPDDLVVNYHAESLDLSKCRRISKKVTKFKNDIKERERADLWLRINYSDDAADSEIEDDEQEFIQQCRYLDLDDDGYEEPYMVTVHEESRKVVRIVAIYDEGTAKINPSTGEVTKIEPYQIYTDYHFIPAFDGAFYSTGFGTYLYPINQSIDTVINQLLDAGTLSNLQGGFIGKGLRGKMGATPFQPGEWRPVDTKGGSVRDNIIPLPAKEPSGALFSLLNFLVDTGKEMSSITDVLAGVPQGANTPVGTTIAMIEQGMKVIDAVYKRVYLALKKEYKMLYRINSVYLDEQGYIDVLDNKDAQKGDYSTTDFDIVPVGDTRISSQMMRTMKAQSVLDVAASTPGANVSEAARSYLKAMEINEAEIAKVLPEGPSQEEMAGQIEFLQGQVEEFTNYIQGGKIDMDKNESEAKSEEMMANARESDAQMRKYDAEAEAQEIENDLVTSGVLELVNG
jgi:chaperonin GroES